MKSKRFRKRGATIKLVALCAIFMCIDARPIWANDLIDLLYKQSIEKNQQADENGDAIDPDNGDVVLASRAMAPELNAPLPTENPQDSNFVYRLIHRMIPGPSQRTVPASDINFPGPDTANFPNSPFTLPKGRSYIETTPFNLSLAGDGAPQTWSWSFLMRSGLTDDVELRIFSNGPTVMAAADGEPAIEGFQPLAFDIKIHLWGEKEWMYIPIVGLETYISSNLASQAFRYGNQPALVLLVDHNFPGDILLEWNVGMYGNGIVQLNNDSEFALGASWALQKQIQKSLAVFYQGFYQAGDIPSFNSDLASGFGVQWNVTQRLSTWGSWNWTLDSMNSPSGGYAGFAYAY